MGKYHSTTEEQRFYSVGERLKAEIDVDITHESSDAPSIRDCRHAVLTIVNKSESREKVEGYVVYDRLLCRIVNGVYYSREMAFGSAQSYNQYGNNPQDMSPNGVALGLLYPKIQREKNISIAFEE